jgi:hypothetical protein
MIFVISRILAIVVALIALYLALFMFEDEEGKWQNSIDELWIAIDDRAKKIGNRTTAIFNKVAGVVTVGLDRLFGRRLFSVRSIGASTSCSSSFVLAMLCFADVFGRVRSGELEVLLIALGVCLLAAILPAILQSRWVIPISLIPIAFLLLYAFSDWSLHKADYAAWNLDRLKGRGPPLLIGALAISFLTDVAFILLTRMSIRKVASDCRNLTIFIAMGLQAASAIFVVVAPIVIMFLIDRHANKGHWQERPVLATTFKFAAGLNAFTSVVCLTLFATLAVVLLHKIFWPILARLVYPLSRYEVFRNRKLWWTLSVACFAYGFQLTERVEKSLLVFAPK